LDESLRYANIAPADVAGNRPALLYPIAMGMVGSEAAIAFTNFVENYEMVVSAEDVLTGKTKAEDLGTDASAKNTVIDKLAEHCKDNKWKFDKTRLNYGTRFPPLPTSPTSRSSTS
jgi:hypothetical protein